MVEKIANAIVEQLEKERLIEHCMKEQYIYALLTMIERWITISTIVIISLFHNLFVPTCLFLLFFLSLRKRTGGYHAEKFWQCYLGTIGTYLFIIVLCPAVSGHLIFMNFMVMVSVVLIAVIGTVNHPNMAMDDLELNASKKSARYLLFIECTIIVGFYFMKTDKLYIGYMSFAVILCAILLVIAKFLRQEV